MRDWFEWHRAYDVEGSPLNRRLGIVQQHVRDALDACPPGPVRIVSFCAGQGRDLIGALTAHPRAHDVQARLVESDIRNCELARKTAPAGVDVVCGDASSTSAYAGAVPAEIVLACGVFGNVSDDDIRRTIATLPSLCAPGATVVWTRHRKPPDRTIDIRAWFRETGFDEVAFGGADDPDHTLFGVGVARLASAPRPFTPDVRMFAFTPEL